jgi:hypothetical protein
VSVCVQCQRTEDDFGKGVTMLYRPPPPESYAPPYHVCSACAMRIRRDQDERAQQAIREAERSGV